MQTYSLEAIITSSVLSFILSGVLVSLFKDWLDRAKLSISITSLGLKPNVESIELPKDIQRLSSATGWCSRFHKYENYEKLHDQLKKLKRVSERLRIAKTSVEEWMQENKSWELSSNYVSVIDEMSKCPYFHDQIVGSLLMGASRRGETKQPPLVHDELTKRKPITELANSEKGWHLYMGDRNILFPTEMTTVETERKAIHQIALSFAVGSKANIFHYMEQFCQLAAHDINEVTDLSSKLEHLLLPASLLNIQVSISNLGTKPATIRPFGKLVMHNQEIDGYSPVLKVLSKEDRKEASSLSAFIKLKGSLVDDGSDGDEVRIEDLLPNSERNDYLFIPPKTSLNIQMISVDPLSIYSERLLAMYKAAVLRCSVKVLPVLGTKPIESQSVIFGSNITKDELAILNAKRG